MNTLHIDLGREWRGGQNQVVLLLRALRARGHGAELVAAGGAPLSARAEAEGVRVHPVGARLCRLGAAWQVRQLLSSRRFDVLHSHEAHGLTAGWLALAHRSLPVVTSRRVAYPLQVNPLALARYRSVHRIICVSEFVSRSVLASGLPPEQLAVVYSGVEVPPLPSAETKARTRERWQLSPGDAAVGCVGYLLPEKGQEELLRAFAAVRAEFPHCCLLLAGDGPLRQRLEKLAAELGVKNAVRFLGFVKDVAAVYAALDVFIFPSPEEPLGTSLLAAMACGLPSVAVAGGAAPEIIQHERNGLLVPRSEPAALADAILRLLRDSPAAGLLGALGRKTIAERFTYEHTVEGTLRVYETLRAARARR
ncbi:MAG: glycosyltransferase family 4 protein [Candidatus Acidiferrales bacterium]